MNRRISLGIAVSLLWSVAASAEQGKTPHCRKILDACRASGFYEGGAPKAKGLWVDCFNIIMAGKAIADVKFDKADIKVCKDEQKKAGGDKDKDKDKGKGGDAKPAAKGKK